MATGEVPPELPPPAPVFWRGRLSPQAHQQARRKVRRRWVGVFVVLAMAVGAGFVAFLFWMRPAPRPVLVGLWLTDYPSAAVPAPPQAEADREAFAGGEVFRLDA